jgi:hypothetical protein
LRASREAQEKARQRAAKRARKKQLAKSKKQWARSELQKELEGDLKDGYKKFYKKEFRKEILEGVRDDFVLEPVVQQMFASALASTGIPALEDRYGDGTGSDWGWWKNTGGAMTDGMTRKTNVTPTPEGEAEEMTDDLERAWWQV